jgi:DNA-binding transcriptional MerR regulator
MSDALTSVEIPNRALFKAAEVCDLVKLQPYVLRSWEAEFPDLGVAKTEGGPRVYRRADVEQVVRIRHLLLVEGLTLAGARRKLQEESTPVAVDAPVLDELMGQHARERLTEVKRGLQSILELLAGRASRQEFQLRPPAPVVPAKRHSVPVARPRPAAPAQKSSSGAKGNAGKGVASTARRKR